MAVPIMNINSTQGNQVKNKNKKFRETSDQITRLTMV